MADRIQLSISIPYIINNFKDGSENIKGVSDECYYDTVFNEYLKNKKLKELRGRYNI